MAADMEVDSVEILAAVSVADTVAEEVDLAPEAMTATVPADMTASAQAAAEVGLVAAA